VVVVVAGCSSSKSARKAAPAPTSAATTASTAAPTTTAPVAASAATSTTAPSPLLAAVSGDVLKLTDLPAGWQAAPSSASESSGNDAGTQQLQTCLGLPPDSANNSPSANADDFGLPVAGGEQVISSSISVGATVAPEVAEFAALQGPKAAACVNQLLSAALQQEVSTGAPGAKLTGVSTAAVNVGTYLDRTVAFQTSATITATNLSGQQTIPASLALVLFQRGRYTAEFEFVGVKAAIDPVVQQKALTTVATRMNPLPAT
jgi:hypothetical protein